MEDDAAAVERLLARLATLPTPDGGPPPGERGRRALPVVASRSQVAPGDAGDAGGDIGGDSGAMAGVG